jgi:DNA mismatch repair ATPase MutL
MDALREYIQNSIDAHTQTIELIVDPSTITVSDDGKGMSREEARNSIRLGISNKNPIEHVGFRGIGIYSAFNLCNRLEVFTKSEDESLSWFSVNWKAGRCGLAG